MNGEANVVKRFYRTVSIQHRGNRYGVLLDGRTAKTPAGNALLAPTEKLAIAVAAEWNAREEKLDRSAMPLSRMLTKSIDADEAAVAAQCREISQYLCTDLLCYRADAPPDLAARQRVAWDPYLAWLKDAFGAELTTTSRIAAVEQPEAAIAAIGEALDAASTPALFALRDATALAGSAVLALAVWKGDFDAEETFEASRLYERFQEKRWGVDSEARNCEKAMRRAFLAVARFMDLVEGE